MDYLYDGTFDGFLSCVYAHYYEEKATGIFLQRAYQKNFLQESKNVDTKEEWAEKVSAAIVQKISPFSFRRIFYVFLAEHRGKELLLLQYIRWGFRLGSKVDSCHQNEVVYEVQQTEKQVTNEVHRLEGLLRFSVLKNQEGGELLYGSIKPDHDVIGLMVHHFGDRLGNRPFLIHDVRREKAVFCQGKQWTEAPLPREVTLSFAEEEGYYRQLWCQYFQAIAIKQRKNTCCQRALMPVRYWENLTELQGWDTLKGSEWTKIIAD